MLLINANTELPFNAACALSVIVIVIVGLAWWAARTRRARWSVGLLQ